MRDFKFLCRVTDHAEHQNIAFAHLLANSKVAVYIGRCTDRGSLQYDIHAREWKAKLIHYCTGNIEFAWGGFTFGDGVLKVLNVLYLKSRNAGGGHALLTDQHKQNTHHSCFEQGESSIDPDDIYSVIVSLQLILAEPATGMGWFILEVSENLVVRHFSEVDNSFAARGAKATGRLRCKAFPFFVTPAWN